MHLPPPDPPWHQSWPFLLLYKCIVLSPHPFTHDPVMLRSHLERGPAKFVELKIWASSENSPGFGRALCNNHIQIGRLAYIFRTPVRASCGGLWPVVNPMFYQSARFSGWPLMVNAISPAGHLQGEAAPAECMLHGKVHIFERDSGEVPERCKIAVKACGFLTPPESATRSEWFLNFDLDPTGLRTSLQIPRWICQFS